MLAMGFMLTATTASAQMTKKGKTYTVNTTTLCNARGFKGTTPLLVTFKGGKMAHPTNPVECCADANPKLLLNDT